MAVARVLHYTLDGSLYFWCPGCVAAHSVNATWTFNGNLDRPTFSPSVLVTSGHYMREFKAGDPCWCTFDEMYPDLAPSGFKCFRCHSFVADGQIQYLGDCTHALAGQTIQLQPWGGEKVA